MNCRTAKKIRKYSQRNWFEYFHAIRGWPFGVRLRFCWQVLFGNNLKRKLRPKKKNLSKEEVLKARQPVKESANGDSKPSNTDTGKGKTKSAKA